MRPTAVIMSDITNHLLEKFGVLETEIFISTILSDRFDYTEWQREHFDGMSIRELNEKAAEATKNYVPPEGVEIVEVCV